MQVGCVAGWDVGTGRMDGDVNGTGKGVSDGNEDG